MSAELSHKTIVDGWFREISDEQWPGTDDSTGFLIPSCRYVAMQALRSFNVFITAMTLRVKKILHVEQSLYQDVLVFESTDHGNVLVLDGAIQCVERDEFSYQEMIAHLPLASHPNPQNVLVIGGGDGGVLREVLKHPSVTSATLCDIDEAVPRVSREYLPHMAAGFNDPRVTVHIGDGFKWLDTHKGEFDVIITDSSDPVGPANSLFQKPYFQLLKEALKPGGSISTQGECIWLHLPLIDNLMTMTRTLFPVAEFAYTSIPTYPSGTIGFVVCTLDENRDLRTPLRDIENTRYWSKAVHKQAFTLPTFAQKVADKSKTKKAVIAGSSSAKSSSPKKVLLLGSGFVAAPAAEYILRRPENSLTIACRNVETAKALASELSREAQAISVDVADEASLDAAVKEHDLVISLIPYTYHTAVIKSAIKFKKNVVTTSYVSDAMKALEAEAIKAGIVVMNEIGVDPGVDHVWAIDMFDRVKQEGGKIKSFISYCGGLPAPESADNPLGYKFSWSSRGVLLALLNSARLYSKGELVEVDGKELMKHAQPYFISPAFAFVAYPNRDSTSFREKYDIPDAETVIRGTLRYQGFPAFIKALVDIKFLNESPVEYLAKGSTPLAWNEVTAKALGTSDKSEKALVEKIKSLTTFPNQAEEERIVSGLKWIGLFGEEKVTPRGNLLDTLCATLEAKMQYEKGERDMVMLQHKFEIENKDGSRETRTSTLLDFGAPVGSGGYSSMAKLVGVPCGVATQLVLDGVINKPGILAPYTRDIVDPLLVELRKEGIDMVEKTL